jgi:hypothetical protein
MQIARVRLSDKISVTPTSEDLRGQRRAALLLEIDSRADEGDGLSACRSLIGLFALSPARRAHHTSYLYLRK